MAENMAVVILVFGGPALALLIGFVLLLQHYGQIPHRWLCITSAVMPITSLLILEVGGYFAQGFSIIPMLPLIPAVLVVGLVLIKSLQQQASAGKVPILLLDIFITWSTIMTWIAMDPCFMGACA